MVVSNNHPQFFFSTCIAFFFIFWQMCNIKNSNKQLITVYIYSSCIYAAWKWQFWLSSFRIGRVFVMTPVLSNLFYIFFFFLIFTCACQRAIPENITAFSIMLSREINSYGTDIKCVVNIGKKSIQYVCYSKWSSHWATYTITVLGLNDTDGHMPFISGIL